MQPEELAMSILSPAAAPSPQRRRPPRIRIRDAGPYIAYREPFNAGNLRGFYVENAADLPGDWQPPDIRAVESYSLEDHGRVYVVVSYKTIIAFTANGLPYTVTALRYSPTTSRHQRMVRAYSAAAR
jgi:hypothetical protein